MRAFVDLRPLRENRIFRRLWLGTTASGFGGQFGAFAVVYYVWQNTHSAVAVGLVGLASGLPLIVLGLAGSAFADHVDRRKLALRCTWGRIAVSAAMTFVAFSAVGGVPAMLALAALSSCFGAIGGPARRAFIPALLSGDRLAAGLAVNHLSFQLAMLLGPAAAGALTATAGVGWCFAFDTATFAAALIGLAGLPSGVPPAEAKASGIGRVKAGLSYRGWVAALEQIVGEAGPQLGNLRGGLVAAVTSGAAALAAGGLSALAATAVIAAGTPALRSFTVSDEAKVAR
jgi:MFS family permease